MYFLRFTLCICTANKLSHPNIHTYVWILSQIVADTQKKKLASISLKIWIWDVHRLVAHVTIAYLHLLYLLCLGRPLPLSLSLSTGACLLLLSWPRAKTARPMPRQGKAQR